MDNYENPIPESMPLNTAGPMKITDENLRRLVLSRPQVQALLRDNSELFA